MWRQQTVGPSCWPFGGMGSSCSCLVTEQTVPVCCSTIGLCCLCGLPWEGLCMQRACHWQLPDLCMMPWQHMRRCNGRYGSMAISAQPDPAVAYPMRHKHDVQITVYNALRCVLLRATTADVAGDPRLRSQEPARRDIACTRTLHITLLACILLHRACTSLRNRKTGVEGPHLGHTEATAASCCWGCGLTSVLQAFTTASGCSL
jgi:hypothetical protein